MNAPTRPLPRPSPFSAPFWDNAKQGRLSVQRCTACGEFQHPPKPSCTHCWSDKLEWVATKGSGTVYSYTICHWATVPFFKEKVPYIVAMVDLEEGVRITAGILDCALDRIRIDLPVVASFDPASDEITLVNFRPA